MLSAMGQMDRERARPIRARQMKRASPGVSAERMRSVVLHGHDGAAIGIFAMRGTCGDQRPRPRGKENGLT